MLVVTLFLALLIGVALGLLGGGGSILAVPLLAYVAGLEPRAAIATSLVVVGVTSAAGAVSHARAGRVRWRTAAVFGATGMVGAYLGGRLAQVVPGTWLMIGFAVVMAATAVAMLRDRENLPEPGTDGPPVRGARPVRLVVDGLVVGLVTGAVGAGGGFLIVPALVVLGGVPMGTAVGTSLVVIALKSGAGLLGHLSGTSIDWTLAAAVTLAAVVGSVAAGRVAGRIADDRLRRVFGSAVAVMAAVILLQELVR